MHQHVQSSSGMSAKPLCNSSIAHAQFYRMTSHVSRNPRVPRSINNNSLYTTHNTQCLPSVFSDSAVETAADICSRSDNWCRVWLTLQHPNPSFSSQCWSPSSSFFPSPSSLSSSSCLPPVLTPSERANIESQEVSVCRDQVVQLLTRLRSANKEMKESVKVLLSGHKMVQCHNTSHCQACMDWYKTWICLQQWPVYQPDTGKVILPCPSQCGGVQMTCPFLTIFEDASMASGDPTFLCQDTSIISSSAEVHQSCCYEVHDVADVSTPPCDPSTSKFLGDKIPVPAEGEYIDLNMTNSCCNILNYNVAGKTGDQVLGAGDYTLNCDSFTIANRTLIVRRRTELEMRGSEAGWLDIDITEFFGGQSACACADHPSLFCLLGLFLVIISTFYS